MIANLKEQIMTDNRDYLDTKIGVFNKDPSFTTIYVGNLVYDFDELEIKDLFEQYGVVNYVKLIKDEKTHESKGIAFVQMVNGVEARTAIKGLDGLYIDERKIKVSIAEEKESSPKSEKKRRKPYKPYISKAKRSNS